MTNDVVEISVLDDVAGIVVYAPSSAPHDTEQMASTMAMRQLAGGEYEAATPSGAVSGIAVAVPEEAPLFRTMVGVLNRRSKKLKLCPAAASQPTRLEVRLSDVQYGAAEHEAADLDDYQKRIALNNQLVQAFGSSRRVRQLGQKAVAKQVGSNVTARDEMEMEIADMGTKAQADGFTTAQVLERVSAERALPAHTPTATTAEGAYKFSAIVKRADHKHLDLGYLQKAALDPMHLSSLRAGHMHGRRVDIFVDHILGLIRVGSDESAHAAATAACQWLGLFNVCRKVLRVRQGVTIVPEAEAADDDAAAELDEVKQEDEEPDAFAQRTSQTTWSALKRRHAFASEAAVQWALSKFGDLVPVGANTLYRRLPKQERLLKCTLAVCAIRCRGNTLQAGAGAALVRSLKPMQHAEVIALMREIGCIVKSAKDQNGAPGFDAKLLPATSTSGTLADALPKIKQRAGPRK